MARGFTNGHVSIFIRHSVCILLGVAVSKDWVINQFDVNNAFLQKTLEEELFMKKPPGFVYKEKPTHVCLLKKAIYGLKKAPRLQYNELRQFLL